MRIGDGIDFTQGVQAASNLQLNKVNAAKSYGSEQVVTDPRESLGVDTASVSGTNLDLTLKGAESAGAMKRAAHVNNIKEQVNAGTYNVSSSAILESAPQLVELVG